MRERLHIRVDVAGERKTIHLTVDLQERGNRERRGERKSHVLLRIAEAEHAHNHAHKLHHNTPLVFVAHEIKSGALHGVRGEDHEPILKPIIEVAIRLSNVCVCNCRINTIGSWAVVLGTRARPWRKGE